MLNIQQAANGGQHEMRSGALEGSDEYWLGYTPPCDSWAINLAGVAQQAARAVAVAPPALVELSPEQEAARRRTGLALIEFFWPDDIPKSPKVKKPATLPPIRLEPLDWPTGFAGEIARYIYQAAIRPVKEVAVIATIGLLAGICGRQWQIPKSGLNVYLILIARSATGKEAMHSGISEIIAACQKLDPTAGQYVDFTEYASGPALIKGCISNKCFVNVSGELGRRVKRLAEDKRDSALQTLRTQLTSLYHKSGANSILGGISYSATDNNVASVEGVSYSLIGETTPGTFLESLTSDMMEDGFMSRFTLIEYAGERPEKNHFPLYEPPKQLVQKVVGLTTQANQMDLANGFLRVERSLMAGVTLDTFNLECDRRIEAAGADEARRQMWNRAHLKVLRIAALLAVADNHMLPLITQVQAEWAINLVLRDIATFSKRMDRGDVGNGDDAREGKLTSILQDYMLSEVPASYNVSDVMLQNSIVPLHYLQKRTGQAPAFKNHHLQAKKALEDTLNGMIAGGYLMELQKDKALEAFSYHGRAYRIIRLPDAD